MAYGNPNGTPMEPQTPPFYYHYGATPEVIGQMFNLFSYVQSAFQQIDQSLKKQNADVESLSETMKKQDDEKKNWKKLESIERTFVTLVAQETEFIELLKEKVKSLEDQLQDERKRSNKLQEKVKSLEHQLQEERRKNTGRCKKTATECKEEKARCEDQVKELQRQLDNLTPMRVLSQQHDAEHDQLIKEYDHLMASVNPGGFLHQLEQMFKDPFDAKQVLTGIFMDAYAKSQKNLFRVLQSEFEKLYKVQNEESQERNLDALSSAFGQLLHSTEVKKELKASAVPHICRVIKRAWPELESCKRAKKKYPWKPEDIDLPLEKVVEVTWKFVTQPSPIVVCLPEKYDSELHKKDHDHWSTNSHTNAKLIYGRPVVYRSYHSIVMRKGLVGNMLT